MAGKLSFILILILFLALSIPPQSFAVMQRLNGQAGQNQTFANDSNISISSAGNIHSILWTGVLPITRGGTGTSLFIDGSIPFISNGVFSEDNTNFYWDSQNGRLGIGTNTPTETLHVNGGILSGSNPNQGGNGTIIGFGDMDLTGSINYLKPFGTAQIYESPEGNLTASPGLMIAGGCLIMQDSDGEGVTYITANDGILSASVTKPSNCQ